MTTTAKDNYQGLYFLIYTSYAVSLNESELTLIKDLNVISF